MSSVSCFVCYNEANPDTTEEIREKYQDVVGMPLCTDSHLCYICYHLVNKLWLFKSVCLKRSLEYPMLESNKPTVNLEKVLLHHTLCVDESCFDYENPKFYRFFYINNNEIDKEIEDVKPKIKEEINLSEHEDLHNDYDDNIDFVDSNNVKNEAKNYENCIDESNSNISVENDPVIKDDLNDLPKEKHRVKKKKSFEKIILTMEQQKANLEAKRRSKKYTESEFKCYNCALGFLFKDSYQAHMMRHEESNGEFQCATCTLRFATPAVLRAHNMLHREIYKCLRCNTQVDPRRKRIHEQRCQNKGDETGAACHLCGNVFKDQNGLHQHIRRFHLAKTSKRIYPCGVCGKTYNNQAAVRTHMIKHIKRKFACDKCQSSYSSPYTLKQHQKMHETDMEEQHYCSSCGKSYPSRKSLLAHKRNALAHQHQLVECTICGFRCANEKSLLTHTQRVHTMVKSYTCTQCSNAYTTRKSLLSHIRARHTERPAPKSVLCHWCGAKFKEKSKLNRHLKKVCEKLKFEEQFQSYPELYNL